MLLIKRFFLALFLVLQIDAIAQDVTKDIEAGNKGLESVKLQMGLYHNPELENLVSNLGNRLVEQLDKPLFEYQFYLLDSEEPNAFALPGGKVFVTRGFLALPVTEGELAGVLGHEIIHSNNRHGMKNTSFLGVVISIPGYIIGGIFGGSVGQAVASPFLAGGQLLQADYSRSHEKEADKKGVVLSSKAGYDPLELADVLARLSAEVELLTGESESRDYFASHPFTPKRVEYIHKKSKGLTPSGLEKLKKPEDFLRSFNGLMIGPNPNYGYITDNHFYHPTQLISIPVSDKWETAITPESFSLGHTDGDAIIVCNAAKDSMTYDQFIDAFKKQMSKSSKLEPTVYKDFDWHGYKGKMLVYETLMQNEKVELQIYAVEYRDEYILKLASLYKTSSHKKVDELLDGFKPIAKTELPQAFSQNIRIEVALENESVEKLIKRAKGKEFGRLTMVINGVSEGHKFKGGELVKVIVKQPFNF